MRLSTSLATATALAAILAAAHPAPAGASEPSGRSAAPAEMTPDAVDETADAAQPMEGAQALRQAMAPRRNGMAGRRTQQRTDPMPASTGATARAETPARLISLSTGTGQLIRLPRAVSNIFIASDIVADVQMKNATSLYLFAKTVGETTIFATDRSGAVVWSSAVRVGNNIAGIPSMLRAAMPGSDIRVIPLNGMVLLNGLVISPKEADEAQRLVEIYTGGVVPVLNHLQIATPQQVMLQVKIVEVSRSVSRNIGVNLANRASGNPLFSIGQGTPGTITTNPSTTTVDPTSGAGPGGTIFNFNQLAGTTLGLAGHAFGADFISTLQLYEQDGLVTTLAEPNLVALSGETASFLAGGEIPVPQSQGLGSVSVNFKQYGVSLAFTPIVLGPGRISLRVRPEVSQLSDAGSVKLNGFTIPGLTTRRADTTVELGSGQSFVIGGLLQNSHNNNTNKAPLLGDLPIIGALFRSNAFRKDESELMIVVTPYIVKPIDAAQVVLPTDGYRSATPVQRMMLDRSNNSDGTPRPKPTVAPAGSGGSTGSSR